VATSVGAANSGCGTPFPRLGPERKLAGRLRAGLGDIGAVRRIHAFHASGSGPRAFGPPGGKMRRCIIPCLVIFYLAFPECDSWVQCPPHAGSSYWANHRQAYCIHIQPGSTGFHSRFQAFVRTSTTHLDSRPKNRACKPLGCSSTPNEVEDLQRQLEEAVAQERYGDAARLRDIIRASSVQKSDLGERPISFWRLQRKGASIEAVREKCQVISWPMCCPLLCHGINP
jgi:hypothetical protein